MCKMLDMIHGNGRRRRVASPEVADASLHDLLHRERRDFHAVYAECCHEHMCNGRIPLLTGEETLVFVNNFLFLISTANKN